MDYKRLVGFASARSDQPVAFGDTATGAKVGIEEDLAPRGRGVKRAAVDGDRARNTLSTNPTAPE